MRVVDRRLRNLESRFQSVLQSIKDAADPFSDQTIFNLLAAGEWAYVMKLLDCKKRGAGREHLPPMPPGQQVIEDYRHLHLSLKAHPVSFLRADLDARGILAHERLPDVPNGRRVTIAGLVLVRQRPGTAKGVIFMTLEDETGIANTIVWPKTFETFRPVELGARLVGVTGKLQNEKGVIHVVAEQIEDLTPLLRRLSEHGPTIESLARCDEVKRPDPGNRSAKNLSKGAHPRRADSLVRLLRQRSMSHDKPLGSSNTPAANCAPRGLCVRGLRGRKPP
jgi:DNA polymerase III alpha subunit